MRTHRIFPALRRERFISLELFKPSNRGRIKDDLRSLNRIDSGRFRKPLVIADERSDHSLAGVDLNVADIPWRKIMLLVVIRIVRNVHLSILAGQDSIAAEN